MYAKKCKVYFSDEGLAYITLAQKTINCHHGVERQVAAKQKMKELKTELKVKYIDIQR